MKKINITFTLMLLVTLISISLVSCQKSEPTATEQALTMTTKQEASKAVVAKEGSYEDGVYFTTEDSFASSGWKYTVTLVVEDGKIVSADWNGVNVNAGPTKKELDKAGKYNMKMFGGAQAEWYEQAQKSEQYLLQTQDPAAVNYTDEIGHTDSISGVSIKAGVFFNLAQKALANGPVGSGMYEDGTYFISDDKYASSGWKEYVSLTVINGYIVGANWSGMNKNGEDKKLLDAAGKYNMVQYGGAQAEWSEQAAKAEQYLLELQDPSLADYNKDDGYTDAISGVSIHVDSFFNLSQAALKAGPVEIGPYTDGGYYAIQDSFSNDWKEYVSLFVENGNIVEAYWSALNEDGVDKKVLDMEGNYNMVAYAGAQAEWYEQANRVEQHLLKTQDVSAISYNDDEGHTDDISGVSIHVDSFYNLAAEALENGAVSYE